MNNKIVYILRHGQTEYNLRGIVQGGGVDTSLNDTGRAQAQAFFQTYGHLPFEKVLTSNLKRTHETVQPFLDQGLDWERHPEITEMGWGVHEGTVSTPESHQEYKDLMHAWESGNYDAALPEGESATQLGERLTRFINHLRQRPEELLLVCSHGRAMRGLMCLLEGNPLSMMSTYGHSNTGLWIAQQRVDGFELLKKNDISHLSLIGTHE